jgi:hypothetical protein
MLSLLINSFDDAIQQYRHSGNGAGHRLVGLMALAEKEEQPKTESMALAILAAAAEDPSLLHQARSSIETRLNEISADNGDGQLAQIVFLALEGLRFLSMLRLLPERFDHEGIFARLLQLARDLPATATAR